MTRARVLVVDDSAAELERCVTALSALPELRAEGLLRSTEALARLGKESFDLLVTDLRMPVVDGLDLLRVATAQDPDMPVLVLTGFPSVDTALSALKEGAADYLTKPVHPAELQAVATRLLRERRLRGEHRLLERRMGHEGEGTDLIGASPAMVRLLDVVRRLAASDLDVLIVGETGTGKELIARRIHRESPQASGRFVAVDCGTIPEQLLESELFGHEKGAFTGADRRSMGLLEYADGGTFFLDEVQSLPLQLQAKLLRALQERRFRRVGGAQELMASVRVVAALNEDPGELMRVGRLREDLYHRLNVGRVELPPLRHRSGDVALLAGYFLGRLGREGTGVQGISAEAVKVLEAYPWPGNVRQLQNVLRRCMALAKGDLLRSDDLPDEIRGEGHREVEATLAAAGTFAEARDRHLAPFERHYLESALRDSLGDVTRACERSGIPRATFYRMLKRHGVDPDRFRVS
ncbi:MAG TPA: sigma-54 dependent transcriptional regulator [Longimicrobiales bacterium]|nr:sigma-54 dependent transcriptional regulator [Longimicrobiales bacterium]